VDISHAEALIGKFVPVRLKDVFFTNGDDVQTFISGRVSSKQRQALVHRSIRDLLGLDSLRMASADLNAVFKRLRAEAAKSGGADVAAAEAELEATDEEIERLSKQASSINESLDNMTAQKNRWDKELTGLRGLGDIDELNSQIEEVTEDIHRYEEVRSRSLLRMRDALRSEECSWSFLDQRLNEGIKLLSDLADRKVIPGIAIEVLTDRLDLEECICGEPLTYGSPRREAVVRLRDDQMKISEARQRLTSLFHTARHSKDLQDARAQQGLDFATIRKGLLKEFVDARDALRGKAAELEILKERRKGIDEARVRDLVEKIGKVEKQIADKNTELGAVTANLDQQTAIREGQAARHREAERASKASGVVVARRDVAEDALNLARGTLTVLEGDYVGRVSARMSELFMSIVGSDPGFEAGVFTGVHIASNFDIVVDTLRERRLDTDFELNGASQRALTLSFIWSLMEVSGTMAPRIIDTPLGMVAGGVKTRMVDVITRPSFGDVPEFQVALFLTRSEIRDIEQLLDERAGMVRTMSCSKDYPEDLLYSWGVDRPLIRVCTCNHRQSCRICARKYDGQHGIVFRDIEAVV
jgi:peptidoglycan hydrolase CwlO-like protein